MTPKCVHLDTPEEQVLALASAMEECPGKGHCACGDPDHLCTLCDDPAYGGQVPRFKELREECPCCGGDTLSPCEDCDDRHWLPLPVAEAAGKIRQMPGFQKWVDDNTATRQQVMELLFSDSAVIAAAYAWAGI